MQTAETIARCMLIFLARELQRPFYGMARRKASTETPLNRDLFVRPMASKRRHDPAVAVVG
jgi:hypothetical protein